MSAKPTNEARADTTCRHSWRGTVPENGERIVTPCPSCGRRTLFIGTGGHLTCGNLGPDCKEPGVERQIELMKSQLAAPPHPAAPADAGDAMRVAQIIEDVIEGRFSGTPINKDSSAIMMLEDALAAARRLLDAPPGVGERNDAKDAARWRWIRPYLSTDGDVDDSDQASRFYAWLKIKDEHIPLPDAVGYDSADQAVDTAIAALAAPAPAEPERAKAGECETCAKLPKENT